MYVFLPNINTLCTFNNREVVLQPIQNVVRISNLFQYQVTSRLVNLPKLIYSAIQISDILVLSVRCKFINLIFHMFSCFLF
jgi:hypothetical protein